MNQLLKSLSCALLVVLLAGCGNLMRQSRSFDTSGSGGITIDASQRAIYSVTKRYPGGAQWTAFCAEPSPDALSALAASFGLDASAATKALGLAINSQDSTASIGLRTQTIQILRDAMYRLCEGYASGALDQTGFTRLQRRYLHIMLALLAIEQITGPVVAQQVALTGSSGASLGKSLGEITKLLAEAAGVVAAAERAEADAKALEKTLAAAVAASKTDGSTPEQVAELEKKHAAAKKAIPDKTEKVAAAKTYYNTLEANLKETERLVLQASSTAVFAPSRAASGGAGDIAAVAGHVKDIVALVVAKDYTQDTCIDVLLSKDGDEIVTSITFEIVAAFCAPATTTGKPDPDIVKSLIQSAKNRTLEVRRAKAEREKSQQQQPTPPTK